MRAYADTGFVISLFLEETTSDAADRAFAAVDGPVLLSPLSRLEMRNALNLAIARGRITAAGRDAAWQAFEALVTAGVFVFPDLDAHALFRQATELATATRLPKRPAASTCSTSPPRCCWGPTRCSRSTIDNAALPQPKV